MPSSNKGLKCTSHKTEKRRGSSKYKFVRKVWNCEWLMSVRCPIKSRITKKGKRSKGLTFYVCAFKLMKRFPNYVFMHPPFKKCEFYSPIKKSLHSTECENQGTINCYLGFLYYCEPFSPGCDRARTLSLYGTKTYGEHLEKLLKSNKLTKEQKEIVKEEIERLEEEYYY